MKAGSLTDEIVILKPRYITNDYGEDVVEEWEELYKTKANVMHSGGYKNINNSELFWGTNKVFKVRYYVPVENQCRILWQKKLYSISVIEEDRKAQQKIITAELINE